MYAIRWVSWLQNCYVDPEKFNSLGTAWEAYDPEESLRWEASPDREVSVEIVHQDVGSFCRMQDAVGLVLDVSKTKLSRVYSGDGWTTLQPDGTLRSVSYNESEGKGVNWSDRWEDAEAVYQSMEDRDEWCEAVVSQPCYVGWYRCEDAPEDVEVLVEKYFGALPEIEIHFAVESED